MQFSFLQLLVCTAVAAIFCGLAASYSATSAEVVIGLLAITVGNWLTTLVCRSAARPHEPAAVRYILELARGAFTLSWAMIASSQVVAPWSDVNLIQSNGFIAYVNHVAREGRRGVAFTELFLAFGILGIVLLLYPMRYRHDARRLFFITSAFNAVVFALHALSGN